MELSEAQYQLIAPYLPVQRGNVSIPNVQVLNVQVLNAILYVAEQGCKRRGLPCRFGNWHTVYTRMNRWSKSGVMDRVFEQLQRAGIIKVKLQVVSMDSTIVKVHPDGAGALKTGPRPSASPGAAGPPSFIWLPRMTGHPDLLPIPGQARDAPEGRKLLRRMGPPEGVPAILMDRAYEGDATRHLAAQLGYTPVVPPKKNRTHPWEYDKTLYRKTLYRRRNEVERLFRRLKGFRRVFTRYDKPDCALPRVHPVRHHLRCLTQC